STSSSFTHAANARGFSAFCLGIEIEPIQRSPLAIKSVFASCNTTKSWRNLRPLFSPRFTSDSRLLPSSATCNCSGLVRESSRVNTAVPSVSFDTVRRATSATLRRAQFNQHCPGLTALEYSRFRSEDVGRGQPHRQDGKRDRSQRRSIGFQPVGPTGAAPAGS